MAFFVWLLFGSGEKWVGRLCVRHAAVWHWSLLLCIYGGLFFSGIDIIDGMVHDTSVSLPRVVFFFFFDRVIPKGLVLRKFCVRCLCMLCFM